MPIPATVVAVIKMVLMGLVAVGLLSFMVYTIYGHIFKGDKTQH